MGSRAAQVTKQSVASILERQTGFLLQLAHQGARRLFNGALEPLKIQAKHLGVLMALSDDESLTQVQLAKRLELDKSSMVLIVDELERLELANRHTHPNDRRAYVLEITGRGRRVVGAAKKIAVAADREIFAGLSPNERSLLDRALSIVIANCLASSKASETR
jgi:DNA-binding MarR family transcriptional regulator